VSTLDALARVQRGDLEVAVDATAAVVIGQQTEVFFVIAAREFHQPTPVARHNVHHFEPRWVDVEN